MIKYMRGQRWIPGLCVLFAALLPSCSLQPSRELSVDFSSRRHWSYELVGTTSGTAAFLAESCSVADTLWCLASGHADSADPSRLQLAVDAVRFSSRMMSEPETDHIMHSIRDARMSFSLIDGFMVLDTTAEKLALPGGRWDLYGYFIRLLPVLPSGKVRPGFSWDRERIVPLPTDYGDLAASLYQAFRFDSVTVDQTTGAQLAHLSWELRYRIGESDTDSLQEFLVDIPKTATGNGYALLDLSGRTLLEASAQMSAVGEAGIAWTEGAVLSLRDAPEVSRR